ncbi:hypothetical protein K502DRAFT_363509 [Neoconidiobolus thromboides FSU 785]|nr:hypothetical protein K502DRAFT_363509 [Neoconidiobolus thromboides FSU 785]
MLLKLIYRQSNLLQRGSVLKPLIKTVLPTKRLTVLYSTTQGQPILYKTNTFRSQLLGPGRRLGLAFVISASLTGFALGAWFFTHLYIEFYLHPTSDKLSSEVRSYLRGAYLREEYQPDPALVEMYLTKAKEKILLDHEVAMDSIELIDVNFRLGENFKIRKQYQDALDCYLQVWYSLIENKGVAFDQLKLIKLLQAGLQISRLYTQMKKYDLAKEYLINGFELSEKFKDRIQESEFKDSLTKLIINHISFEKINLDYRIELALNSTLKKEYDLALNLYFDCLKDIQKLNPIISSNEIQNKNASSDTETKPLHPWGAIESIVLGYIAQTTYGKTGSVEESLPWAWKSYKTSEPYHHRTVDGEVSGATAMKTLASFYTLKKDFNQAQACLSKALSLANAAADNELALSIGKQLAKIQDRKEVNGSENTKVQK